mmetsp:Transcript_64656/g.193180  ORF Transcript_64656/g.193180 Transcript_64656/m.193180 type:complete len:241 (+) Transcript_64656:1335-2057(+)
MRSQQLQPASHSSFFSSAHCCSASGSVSLSVHSQRRAKSMPSRHIRLSPSSQSQTSSHQRPPRTPAKSLRRRSDLLAISSRQKPLPLHRVGQRQLVDRPLRSSWRMTFFWRRSACQAQRMDRENLRRTLSRHASRRSSERTALRSQSRTHRCLSRHWHGQRSCGRKRSAVLQKADARREACLSAQDRLTLRPSCRPSRRMRNMKQAVNPQPCSCWRMRASRMHLVARQTSCWTSWVRQAT